MTATRIASIDLDLDVFQGPFDLLLTLILNQEVDLLEVDLAEVVIAYIEHLEARHELDLEAATEFLVLIAALLEFKSRLMLPSEGEDEMEMEPEEAAEELLARLLEYRKAKRSAGWLIDRLIEEGCYRYRSALLPSPLRKVSLEAATKAYEPALLVNAISSLLQLPPSINLEHIRIATVSLQNRLDHLRSLRGSGGSFTFAAAGEGEDRRTQAMTLFALLELYKKGEASWQQPKPFGEITINGALGSNGTRKKEVPKA